MRARRLLGIAAVTSVVTYAIRRDLHQHIGKRVIKRCTVIRQNIEDRALAFAISHMADGMTRAIITQDNQKAGSIEVETPRVVLDSPVVLESSNDGVTAHFMGGSTPRTTPSEDHSGPIEPVDTVDEIPEK